MRKNLQHIKLKNSIESGTADLQPATRNLQPEVSNLQPDSFLTAEGIELKPTYSQQDIENLEHLDFGAGFAPNLRGPYATM
ncbi:MAG TPA: hypothetical protein VLR29_09745 [Flavobacterium sp.]|nr:hypothetical protein [Flavobacterium sp.]